MKRFSLVVALAILVASFVVGQTITKKQKSANNKNTEDALKQEFTNDQIDRMEKSLSILAQNLSKDPIEENVRISAATFENVPPKDREAELVKQRLGAIERSLSNIAKASSEISTLTNSGCRLVKECVYYTCCRYGAPTSDPGTVKCLDQCCGAHEYVWRCD